MRHDHSNRERDLTESIGSLLTQDHDEIDALFQRAVDGDSAARTAFEERLRLHMRIEEEILFPALSDTPLAVPARVMVKEHDLLRDLLDKDDLEALPSCLGSHNVKEENVIYPACEGPTFAPQLAKVREALAARR